MRSKLVCSVGKCSRIPEVMVGEAREGRVGAADGHAVEFRSPVCIVVLVLEVPQNHELELGGESE